MLKKLAISAAVVGAALTFVPISSADPDPHIPNGEAGFCPGGEPPSYGGARYCLGIPFPNGAFYAQTGSFGASGPFGPWSWHSGAACSVMVEGSVQGGIPYGGVPDCGGGPRFLN
jgi:hypothetical protein